MHVILILTEKKQLKMEHRYKLNFKAIFIIKIFFYRSDQLGDRYISKLKKINSLYYQTITVIIYKLKIGY